MWTTKNDPGTGGAAAREMPLNYRIVRHEFRSLQQLVTEVPPTDMARVRAISGHLAFMLDDLHTHHTTEDDFVWPLVSQQAGADAPLATRMEEQHRQIDTAVARVRDAKSTSTANPTGPTATALAAWLDEFLEVTEHHLDEEERDVVPLIDRPPDGGRVGGGRQARVREIHAGPALDRARPAARRGCPGKAAMMFGNLRLPVRLCGM